MVKVRKAVALVLYKQDDNGSKSFLLGIRDKDPGKGTRAPLMGRYEESDADPYFTIRREGEEEANLKEFRPTYRGILIDKKNGYEITVADYDVEHQMSEEYKEFGGDGLEPSDEWRDPQFFPSDNLPEDMTPAVEAMLKGIIVMDEKGDGSHFKLKID